MWKQARLRLKNRARSAEVDVVATRLWRVLICSIHQLDRADFFQRFVSAVLIDCLQPARSHANTNEFFQLRHPDPVLVQVRYEQPRYVLGHVPADAALLLGHTAAVNDAPAGGLDPVISQIFDIVKKRGAHKMPRRGRLSNDLLAKADGVF